MSKKIPFLLCALFLWAACSSRDSAPCTPIADILERGPSLFDRIKQSRDALNKNRKYDETMGKLTCTYTVSVPGTLLKPAKQTITDLRFELTDLNRCFDLGKVTSIEQLMSCLIVQSLDLINLTVKLQLEQGGIPKDMLAAVKVSDVRCTPTELKLVPDTRFLNRDIMVLPLMIQLLEEGGKLVPSPASIPLLFPGVLPGHGEEACVEIAPAKRCADTSGCVPGDSESPDGGSTIGAPPVVGPGSGSPGGGDHLP